MSYCYLYSNGLSGYWNWGRAALGPARPGSRPLLDHWQQPRSDDAQTQTLFLPTLSQAISSFQTLWWIIQYLDYHSRESKKTRGKRIWSVRPKPFSLWILILVTPRNESFLKGPTVNTPFLNHRPQIKLRGTQKTFCTGEVGNTKWSYWYFLIREATTTPKASHLLHASRMKLPKGSWREPRCSPVPIPTPSVSAGVVRCLGGEKSVSKDALRFPWSWPRPRATGQSFHPDLD